MTATMIYRVSAFAIRNVRIGYVHSTISVNDTMMLVVEIKINIVTIYFFAP